MLFRSAPSAKSAALCNYVALSLLGVIAGVALKIKESAKLFEIKFSFVSSVYLEHNSQNICAGTRTRVPPGASVSAQFEIRVVKFSGGVGGIRECVCIVVL